MSLNYSYKHFRFGLKLSVFLQNASEDIRHLVHYKAAVLIHCTKEEADVCLAISKSEISFISVYVTAPVHVSDWIYLQTHSQGLLVFKLFAAPFVSNDNHLQS